MNYSFRCLIFSLVFLCSCQKVSNQKDTQYNSVKDELSSDFFHELYSNTYHDIINRIEPDGFFQESKTGRYDGMYCRTVGALVSLLIETGEAERAEHVINCIFDAMKTSGLTRVPHVIDRKLFPDKPADSVKNPYGIIGRTDQIDGQAHVIMAWARLALYRGETDFENRTWPIVSALMTSSTQPPYLGLAEEGTLSNLIHNYAFEHSRMVPSHYNLLTQCFVGAALEAMIAVAEKRNENKLVSRWKKSMEIIRAGVQQHLIRKVDRKEIYYELLLKENNTNIPFDGMGWVNLSPIAAQWEPLSHEVTVNTVQEFRKGMQTWNGIKWMPTDSWPDGEFFGQMIGKGVGWEIDYATQEKEWARIGEILAMLKVIQYQHPIYMENSFITNGSPQNINRLTKEKLKELENGIWKVVDPGNGEQVAWWCWSMARLRKAVGLSATPEKKMQEKSNKENLITEKTNNGVTYHYYVKNKKEEKPFYWEEDEPQITGTQEYIDLNVVPLTTDDFGMRWNGFIKIEENDDYSFFPYALNPCKVFINGEPIAQGGADHQQENMNKPLYLEKGYYPLTLLYDHVLPDETLKLYFQQGKEPKRALIKPNMLFHSIPTNKASIPPVIHPVTHEIEKEETLLISITCSSTNAAIYYTLDGSEPSEHSMRYTKPFTIASSTIVKAISQQEGLQKSAITQIRYTEVPKKMVLKLKYPPHPNYSGRGQRMLIDQLLGSVDSFDGKWLGFSGTDLDAIFNLREVKAIHNIKINFLHNQGSWVFAPRKVSFYISHDGKQYSKINEEDFSLLINKSEPAIKTIEIPLKNTKAQFIRIYAENIGSLPAWHPSAGYKAMLLVDEITIQ
jgi:hypothetical protein